MPSARDIFNQEIGSLRRHRASVESSCFEVLRARYRFPASHHMSRNWKTSTEKPCGLGAPSEPRAAFAKVYGHGSMR